MKRVYDKEKHGYLINARNELLENLSISFNKRLAKCTAWYYTDNNGWIWLKSYQTVVAVYVPEDDTLYSYGRYSATTYQHVRKFRNNVCPNMHYTKEVNIEFDNWY